MNIGYFQLENLIVARAPFCFLNLRSQTAPELPAALKALLQQAQMVDPDNTLKFLQENKIGESHPIVLLCQDGAESAIVEQRLEAQGYRNVYVVAGGVLGLLEEF